MQRQVPGSVNTTVTVNDLFLELGKKTAQVSKLQEVLSQLTRENQMLRAQNESLMRSSVHSGAGQKDNEVQDASELALMEDVGEETRED